MSSNSFRPITTHLTHLMTDNELFTIKEAIPCEKPMFNMTNGFLNTVTFIFHIKPSSFSFQDAQVSSVVIQPDFFNLVGDPVVKS